MHYFQAKDFRFPLKQKTFIMGILNITPDSFSDGGLYVDPDIALIRAMEIQNEGADILDIGAMSTGPGSKPITQQEECERLAPVLRRLKDNIRIPISIDTVYPATAEYALQNGACIINDVSGIFREEMAGIVKNHQAGWIMAHTFQTDASTIVKTDDIILQVNRFFSNFISKTEQFGLERSTLCLDPGFGFGKSYEDNMKLLANFDKLEHNDAALCCALSRKRLIGQTCQTQTDQRLYGTLAANTIAIMSGADIIRVHDVRQAFEGAAMADGIRNYRL